MQEVLGILKLPKVASRLGQADYIQTGALQALRKVEHLISLAAE